MTYQSNIKRFFDGFNIVIFTLILLFLYIPILILIIYSFNDSKIISGWSGFTFKYYKILWENENLKNAFLNSLLVASISTIISTTIGLITALGLENRYFKAKKFIQGIIFLPLVMPDILMGISIAMLFSFLRFPMGRMTVIIAHITFCVSYTIIVIQSRLKGFDHTLQEAAMDLGANKTKFFWKVKFPIILPGILAAALLAFTLSLDDFIITFFSTGRGFNTLPIYVESAIRRGSVTTINALSTIMILLTLFITIISKPIRKMII
ncbi:ABC transporter permease [bacterium]|nr:ABC transporter permease [bacterium]